MALGGIVRASLLDIKNRIIVRLNRVDIISSLAAHRWRCDGWARRKSFCWEGEPQRKLQKHDQHVLTYDQLAWITAYIYFGVPPPPTQYRRAILYDTYTIHTLTGSPRWASSSTHLPKVTRPPPFKASHPPAFIIIQQPGPAARGILSSFVLQRT